MNKPERDELVSSTKAFESYVAFVRATFRLSRTVYDDTQSECFNDSRPHAGQSDDEPHGQNAEQTVLDKDDLVCF